MKIKYITSLAAAIAVLLAFVPGYTYASSWSGSSCESTSLVPTSGIAGSQVVLTVPTTDASEYIITWNNTPILGHGNPIELTRGYLSGGGAFTVQLTIPESPGGIYYICFQADGGATRTNLQFNLQPDFSLTPSIVKTGDPIQISGTGFPAGEHISVYFNSILMDSDISANSKGSFYKAVQTPSIDPGIYKITVSNYSQTINKSIVVQVLKPEIKEEPVPTTTAPAPVPEIVQDILPPPNPVPQSPMGDKIGYFGDQIVTFRWSEVTDESGVRYTIEVCKDPAGLEPVLEIDNLAANYYTTKLKPGVYYWRVKATDGSGNVSDWYTAQYSFQISEASSLWMEFTGFMERTRIFIIILWAIGIYVLASLLIFFIRKMKRWQNRNN